MVKKSANRIAEERQEKRENELIAEGWVTARVSMKRRWSKGKDLFGLFDILAFREGQVILSQVTSHSSKGYIRLIEAWMDEHEKELPHDLICEVAIWKPTTKTLPERFNIHTMINKRGR